MQSEVAALVLGSLFGVATALSIRIAHLVAVWFARGSVALDLLLRLGTFGLLIIGMASLIGNLFASIVRCQSGWFLGGIVFGFGVLPWAFNRIARRHVSARNDG
jgi:hypothetical protein